MFTAQFRKLSIHGDYKPNSQSFGIASEIDRFKGKDCQIDSGWQPGNEILSGPSLINKNCSDHYE
jgi:hypothetical protein